MTLAATIFEPLLLFLAGQTASDAQAQWPKGPTVFYRNVNGVPLATYVQWVKDVEASPLLAGATSKQIVQRMCRLYFSSFTESVKGPAARLADSTIADITTYAEPALTTEHVPLATLNGLYGTSTFRTANGLLVDAGHLWMPPDVMLNGTKDLTAAVGATFFLDSPLEALLSWTGDVGGAANDWSQEVLRNPAIYPDDAARDEGLLRRINANATQDDLLGDMDSVILAHRWSGLSSFVVSAEIANYYVDDAKTQALAKPIAYPNSARRFHHFLNVAKPALPATGKDSTPLDLTVNRATLAAALAQPFTDAADDLISGGILLGAFHSGPNNIKKAGQASFEKLCANFAAWIEKGLTDPKAPWPPAV